MFRSKQQQTCNHLLYIVAYNIISSAKRKFDKAYLNDLHLSYNGIRYDTIKKYE